MISFVSIDFFYSLKEFYIVESGFSTDDAIEIIDENRGHIYVKEMLIINDENDESIRTIDQEPEQGLIVFIFQFDFNNIFFSSSERTFQRND